MHQKRRGSKAKGSKVKPKAKAEIHEHPTGLRQPDNFWKIRNRRLAKIPRTELTVDDIQPVKVIFADSRYKSAIPTPEKMREVWEVFLKYAAVFDDEGRDPHQIWGMLVAPTTMIWEVPGKVLYYFTSIVPGHMACSHVIATHRDGMRQYDLGRELLRQIMDHPMLKLQRMNAFIGTSNRQAIWFARCIGFRREGILRRWIRRNGQFEDIVTLGLLRKELDHE